MLSILILFSPVLSFFDDERKGMGMFCFDTNFNIFFVLIILRYSISQLFITSYIYSKINCLVVIYKVELRSDTRSQVWGILWESNLLLNGNWCVRLCHYHLQGTPSLLSSSFPTLGVVRQLDVLYLLSYLQCAVLWYFSQNIRGWRCLIFY